MKIRLKKLLLCSIVISPNFAGAQILQNIEFSSITGPGSSSTDYIAVNWTDNANGLINEAGYMTNSVTTNSAASGLINFGFGLNAHKSGLDGQNIALSANQSFRINTRTDGTPYNFSFGSSVSHLLMYIGTSATDNIKSIKIGDLTLASGFEFVTVATATANFDVGTSGTPASFNHTLGNIGNMIDPQNTSGTSTQRQTAGAVIVRRTDGANFSQFSMSPDDLGTPGDVVPFQIALPVTPVPEPSSSLLIATGIAFSLTRRSRQK